MEQNNPPETNEIESVPQHQPDPVPQADPLPLSSDQPRNEWLKVIIFFGAVLLVTFLAIRVIAPFIFAEYVPTIVGMDGDTSAEIESIEEMDEMDDAAAPEAEETEGMEGTEETEPADASEPEPEAGNADPENGTEGAEEQAEVETAEPLPTDEVTAGKTDEAAESGETAEPDAAAAETTYTIYTIRPGDTLTSIAKAHGLTVQELIAANQLVNPNLLKAGQELQIPE